MINLKLTLIDRLIFCLKKCFSCKDLLKPGEIAISAENIDKNARLHQECFSCSVCSEILVDLLYYYKNNKIYCQKHYNQSQLVKACAACDLVF